MPDARRVGSMAALALLLAGLAVGARAGADGGDRFDPAAALGGTWRVEEVFCRGCAPGRRPAEVGTELRIGGGSVVNPLGGDCEGAAGFGAFRAQPWREAAAQAGLPPPRAGAILADGRRPVMRGAVTCQGLDYAPVVSIDRGTALYLFEGGVSFLLRRVGDGASR